MDDPEPLEGQGRVPPGERLSVFALVIYIPGSLGDFLDDLRRELVPHYNPHAHISVLPPRPITGDWQSAAAEALVQSASFASFDIELTGVQVFPVTDVVYIGVGGGASELYRMHTAMNSGRLQFQDVFAYHPHVTVAQELPPEQVDAAGELARRRWREFRGSRRFRAEQAVFVQNTDGDQWIDLAELSLGNTGRNS